MARSKIPAALPSLPRRAPDANKGDCGRVVIVGGSRGMAGAPCLAARAACRGGAGLVRAAVPEPLWDVVAVKLDECLTAGLPATPEGTLAERALEPLLALADAADVVVLGPGLSRHPETSALVRAAVPRIARALVLDADGLNAFAGALPLLAGPRAASVDPLPLRGGCPGGTVEGSRAPQDHRAPLLLTPHPGEMARLLGGSARDIQADREGAARACARQVPGSVVILKGAGTLVTDGERLYVNRTGNAGLASGGTGDVLAGLLGALLGQGMTPFDAACLSVYLHGLAGDLAARRLGVWSLVAGDLLDELPRAFLTHTRRGRRNRDGTR